MKKYFTVAALICGLALAGASSLQAANGQGNLPQGPGWNNNYTPQQWEEARRILDENNAGMAPIRQELASKREILDRELAKQNPDPATIEKLSREIGELRGKMLGARVNVRNRLAERGLPTDCYGPCMGGGYGGMGGMMGGWYGGMGGMGSWRNYYNERGGRHPGPRHGGHGYNGYWR